MLFAKCRSYCFIVSLWETIRVKHVVCSGQELLFYYQYMGDNKSHTCYMFWSGVIVLLSIVLWETIRVKHIIWSVQELFVLLSVYGNFVRNLKKHVSVTKLGVFVVYFCHKLYYVQTKGSDKITRALVFSSAWRQQFVNQTHLNNFANTFVVARYSSSIFCKFLRQNEILAQNISAC